MITEALTSHIIMGGGQIWPQGQLCIAFIWGWIINAPSVLSLGSTPPLILLSAGQCSTTTSQRCHKILGIVYCIVWQPCQWLYFVYFECGSLKHPLKIKNSHSVFVNISNRFLISKLNSKCSKISRLLMIDWSIDKSKKNISKCFPFCVFRWVGNWWQISQRRRGKEQWTRISCTNWRNILIGRNTM